MSDGPPHIRNSVRQTCQIRDDWGAVEIGACRDGRRIVYDQARTEFAVGGIVTTPEVLVGYDGSGYVDWVSDDIRQWVHECDRAHREYLAQVDLAALQPRSRVRDSDRRDMLTMGVAAVVLIAIGAVAALVPNNPLLQQVMSGSLDLELLKWSALACFIVWLSAAAYARLYPRLDRSGDIWSRSAPRPVVTQLRFAAQTLWYLVAAVATTTFVVSGILVVGFRTAVGSDVSFLVGLLMWFLISLIVALVLYAVPRLWARGSQRAMGGIDACSELEPDTGGRMRARRLAHLTRAAPAMPGDLAVTRRALQNVAIAAGLSTTPELLRIPFRGPGLNAFVDGVDEHMVIGVTPLFTERMSEAEQQAALASLVARATGSIPDALGQEGAASLVSYDTLMSQATQVYVAADHAGLMLTRSPEAMIRALEIAITTPEGTEIRGIDYSLAPRCWAWPGACEVPYSGVVDLERGERPECERIRALQEVVGAAGVVARRARPPQG